MVAGHLTLKNGKYYAVLNYKNAGGQRKTKWISLGLSEKGNKRRRRRNWRGSGRSLSAQRGGRPEQRYAVRRLSAGMAGDRQGAAGCGNIQFLRRNDQEASRAVLPPKKSDLAELEARHLQMFYSEMLRKVKPNTVIHYHAIIHSALKYAVKTDMLVQNVADKVDRPKKNSFQRFSFRQRRCRRV